MTLGAMERTGRRRTRMSHTISRCCNQEVGCLGSSGAQGHRLLGTRPAGGGTGTSAVPGPGLRQQPMPPTRLQVRPRLFPPGSPPSFPSSQQMLGPAPPSAPEVALGSFDDGDGLGCLIGQDVSGDTMPAVLPRRGGSASIAGPPRPLGR